MGSKSKKLTNRPHKKTTAAATASSSSSSSLPTPSSSPKEATNNTAGVTVAAATTTRSGVVYNTNTNNNIITSHNDDDNTTTTTMPLIPSPSAAAAATTAAIVVTSLRLSPSRTPSPSSFPLHLHDVEEGNGDVIIENDIHNDNIAIVVVKNNDNNSFEEVYDCGEVIEVSQEVSQEGEVLLSSSSLSAHTQQQLLQHDEALSNSIDGLVNHLSSYYSVEPLVTKSEASSIIDGNNTTDINEDNNDMMEMIIYPTDSNDYMPHSMIDNDDNKTNNNMIGIENNHHHDNPNDVSLDESHDDVNGDDEVIVLFETNNKIAWRQRQQQKSQDEEELLLIQPTLSSSPIMMMNSLQEHNEDDNDDCSHDTPIIREERFFRLYDTFQDIKTTTSTSIPNTPNAAGATTTTTSALLQDDVVTVSIVDYKLRELHHIVTLFERQFKEIKMMNKSTTPIMKVIENDNEIDLWKLREMAITKGGLLNHHIRKVAWPILASLHMIDDHDNNNINEEIKIMLPNQQEGKINGDSSSSQQQQQQEYYQQYQQHWSALGYNDLNALQHDLYDKKEVEKFILFHVISSVLLSKRNNNNHIMNHHDDKNNNNNDIINEDDDVIMSDEQKQEVGLQLPSLVLSSSESPATTATSTAVTTTSTATATTKPIYLETPLSSSSSLPSGHHYYNGLVDLTSIILMNLPTTSDGILLLQRLAEVHLHDAFRGPPAVHSFSFAGNPTNAGDTSITKKRHLHRRNSSSSPQHRGSPSNTTSPKRMKPLNPSPMSTSSASNGNIVKGTTRSTIPPPPPHPEPISTSEALRTASPSLASMNTTIKFRNTFAQLHQKKQYEIENKKNQPTISPYAFTTSSTSSSPTNSLMHQIVASNSNDTNEASIAHSKMKSLKSKYVVMETRKSSSRTRHTNPTSYLRTPVLTSTIRKSYSNDDQINTRSPSPLSRSPSSPNMMKKSCSTNDIFLLSSSSTTLPTSNSFPLPSPSGMETENDDTRQIVGNASGISNASSKRSTDLSTIGSRKCEACDSPKYKVMMNNNRKNYRNISISTEYGYIETEHEGHRIIEDMMENVTYDALPSVDYHDNVANSARNQDTLKKDDESCLDYSETNHSDNKDQSLSVQTGTPRSLVKQFLSQSTSIEKGSVLLFITLLQKVDRDTNQKLIELCQKYYPSDTDFVIIALPKVATVLSYYVSTWFVTAATTWNDDEPHQQQSSSTTTTSPTKVHVRKSSISLSPPSKKSSKRKQFIDNQIHRKQNVVVSQPSFTTNNNDAEANQRDDDHSNSSCSSIVATERSYEMASRLADFFLVSHPLMPIYFAVAVVSTTMNVMKQSHVSIDPDKTHHHSNTTTTSINGSNNSKASAAADNHKKYDNLESELHSWFQFQTLALLLQQQKLQWAIHHNSTPNEYNHINGNKEKKMDSQKLLLLNDDRIHLELTDIIEDIIDNSITFMKHISPAQLISWTLKFPTFSPKSSSGMGPLPTAGQDPNANDVNHDVTLLHCIDPPNWMIINNCCLSSKTKTGSSAHHSEASVLLTMTDLLKQRHILQKYPLAIAACGVDVSNVLDGTLTEENLDEMDVVPEETTTMNDLDDTDGIKMSEFDWNRTRNHLGSVGFQRQLKNQAKYDKMKRVFIAVAFMGFILMSIFMFVSLRKLATQEKGHYVNFTTSPLLLLNQDDEWIASAGFYSSNINNEHKQGQKPNDDVNQSKSLLENRSEAGKDKGSSSILPVAESTTGTKAAVSNLTEAIAERNNLVDDKTVNNASVIAIESDSIVDKSSRIASSIENAAIVDVINDVDQDQSNKKSELETTTTVVSVPVSSVSDTKNIIYNDRPIVVESDISMDANTTQTRVEPVTDEQGSESLLQHVDVIHAIKHAISSVIVNGGRKNPLPFRPNVVHKTVMGMMNLQERLYKQVLHVQENWRSIIDPKSLSSSTFHTLMIQHHQHEVFIRTKSLFSLKAFHTNVVHPFIQTSIQQKEKIDAFIGKQPLDDDDEKVTKQ